MCSLAGFQEALTLGLQLSVSSVAGFVTSPQAASPAEWGRSPAQSTLMACLRRPPLRPALPNAMLLLLGWPQELGCLKRQGCLQTAQTKT